VITVRVVESDITVQRFLVTPLRSTPAIQTVTPLERRTLGEKVYTEVRELLVSGRLAPGERLSLRSAAEAMGVSIMPVREAVSRLVAERALEVAPSRAVRVPLMSASHLRELATVRTAIEGYACEQAALRRTPDDLKRIAGAEAAFRRESLSRHPDLAAAVEMNKDVHFAVYHAAGMPSLVEIIGSLWLKIGPVLNLDLRENPERLVTGGAYRFHADMLEAIRLQDGARARAALAEDIASAAAFILQRRVLREG
jgi:DNA-binding GntR family transcriptional regulator